MSATPAGTRPTHASALVALLVVQLFFGGMPVFGKLAITSFGPTDLAFLRMAAGALTFQLLRAALGLPHVPRRDQPAVFLCAILGISANQLLFLEGLSRTSATHAALLTTLIPVLTLGAAALLGRERLHLRRIAGIVVSLSGALLLMAGRDASGVATLTGDLLVVANTMVYAFYLVLSRDLLERHAPLSVLAWLFTWGLLTAIPFIGVPTLSGHDQRAWLAAGFVVLGPTIGSYWLNLYALRTVPASVVAIFIYLQPIIAAALALPLLGERPTPRLFVAGILAFAGVAIARRADVAASRPLVPRENPPTEG